LKAALDDRAARVGRFSFPYDRVKRPTPGAAAGADAFSAVFAPGPPRSHEITASTDSCSSRGTSIET
jgi:hypothetical protein